MGIIGDIVEAKSFWRKASISGRIFISTFLFLTVSAITSLSDTIFKWKGFILDGLNFYHLWFSVPIINFFTIFQMNVSQLYIDSIIVSSLGFAAIYRTKLINRDPSNYYMPEIAVGIGQITTCILFYFVLDGFLSYLSLLGMAVVVLYYPFSPKINLNKNEKIVYYTPILLSFFSVLILAAINLGLTKPIV